MSREHSYCVYILASSSGTLYVGVTDNLRARVWQHKSKKFDGFTAQYGVDRQMYWEIYQWVQRAIAREKQLKGWTRSKKIALIEKKNPSWKDLSREWYREEMRRVEPQGFGEG